MYWDIEFQTDGSIDVKKNRRLVKTDLDDLDEVRRWISRSRFYDPSDTVTVIETDGYRRPLRMH